MILFGSTFLDCSADMLISLSHVYQDPVCGSAHCALAPYWSQKLGKLDVVALAVFFPYFSFEPSNKAVVVTTLIVLVASCRHHLEEE